MSARVFRVEGVGYAGFTRHDVKFTFSTNEIEMELIWMRARREARKRLGIGISISIEKLTEV